MPVLDYLLPTLCKPQCRWSNVETCLKFGAMFSHKDQVHFGGHAPRDVLPGVIVRNTTILNVSHVWDGYERRNTGKRL